MKSIRTRGLLQITNYKLLLATVLALALTLIPGTALTQDPTPTDDEVNRIAKHLYCPVCENVPLDVCPTEACRQWRDLIHSMLSEGKSEEEIQQYFVIQYGARVLAEPPNRLVTYLVPAVAILLGAFMLFRGFQMWMKPSVIETDEEDREVEPVPDPYIARLEEELKKRK